MDIKHIIALKENRLHTLMANGKENQGVIRKLKREIRNLKNEL